MENLIARASLSLALSGNKNADAQGELGSPLDTVSLSRGTSFAHGSGSGEANVFYHDVLNITDTATLIFNDGSISDSFGVGIVMTSLKLLYIKNNTGGNLTLGNYGVATNQIPIFPNDDDELILPDGGEFLWSCPAGITVSSTHDEIKLTHDAGGAQKVEVIAVGVV